MSETKELSLNDIFNIQDCTIEKVEVPEWGGHVFIKTLSAEAMDEYDSSLVIKDEESNKYVQDVSNRTAKLVAACLCTSDGTRLVKGIAQVKALGSKSKSAIDTIYQACIKLNKMGDDEKEDVEGNSEADQP